MPIRSSCRPIHEDDVPIVVIERRARGLMAAPVGMLHRSRMIMVMIVVLGQVDVRWRQRSSTHHRRNEQRCGRGAAEPGGNHAGILSGEVNKGPSNSGISPSPAP